MPVVLAHLFHVVAGLALFIILIHYISYIIIAVTRDLYKKTLLNHKGINNVNAIKIPEQSKGNVQVNVNLNVKLKENGHENENENANVNVNVNVNIQNMQTSDDTKFIKKRWKGGSIEPHPTDKALIVNYQLEATVFGDTNNPVLGEKKNCQKIIRLRSLNARTDPAALAREVVNKCDLIHKSQLADVEQIIFYLKNRKDNTTVDLSDSNMGHRSAIVAHRSLVRPHTTAITGNTFSSTQTQAKKPASSSSSDITINHIDEYVELLYEDLNERIRGSGMILQITRSPDNLEELEKNEACLSALSRVLREDWRKSLDLATNIIYIFFCFSTYTKFHPIIVQYKIGSLCMDVIDYELRRYDSMRHEIDTRKNPSGSNSVSAKASKEKLNNSSDDFLDLINEERPKEMEPPRRRIPELKQRPKSGNWSSFHSSMSSSYGKSQILNGSYHEALPNGARTPDSGMSSSGDMKTTSNETLDQNDLKSKKEETERLCKQLKVFAKKQEQLLRVAFYLLLNMAENIKLEEKMRRKHIVKMLVKTLDRQNIDLLMLVSTFLKKLSIVGDNKDDMSNLNIISKLPRLLQSGNTELVQVTLKLVFNLSFDGTIRKKMISTGYLPIMVMFINDEKHHGIAVKILYHMSLDDKIKAMFTHTECVQMATDAMILNLNSKVDLDLIALCINLSLNRRNAQIMVEGNRLHSLMERAFKYQDSLLMKLLRNISQHNNLKPLFIEYVPDLARILTIYDDEAFMVECLGILGNLALPDLDYSQILQNFELIPWIRDNLVPGAKLDDIVLDTIIYLGTCARDELCALLLCRANVILSLIELLKAKQEDDEIVLQIIFVFQQILRHESTREYMIKDTESPAYLIDLMHDKNAEIRKVCDYCLDIVALSNNEWAKRIKLEKFRNHNSQWLCMVESQQHEDNNNEAYNDQDDDDNELDNYLRTEYLNNCGLYTSSNRSNKENDDDNDSNNPASPTTSIYSRPVSSYVRSQDLDDLYMSSSTKSSQDSHGGDNSYINKLNKSFDTDSVHEELLLA